MASTSRKLDSGVGFSNGCAELTLKKPPPLVPSCLIAICEAAGPTAMTLLLLRRLLGHRVALVVLDGLTRGVELGIVVLDRFHQRCGRIGGEGLHHALRHQRPARESATAAAGCRAWCG